MDQMLDALRALRLSGGVFLDAEFTAPWCIVSRVGPKDCLPFAPDIRHIIAYHYIIQGEFIVGVEGQAQTVARAGDILVLPRNDRHVIGSALGPKPASVDHLIRPGTDGAVGRLRFGGGGTPTHILCGFLGHDTPHHPLFAMLPTVMKINVADGSGAWIESSFRLANDGVSGVARSPVMLAKLAEVLFMDAVRRYLAAREEPNAALTAGMQDAVVARGLAAMHKEPLRDWTTESLAEVCGLSRSAFAERFARAVGEPPMRYLARFRIETAAMQLRESSRSVAEIAFGAGYESEAAFSRAFSRHYGTPPATWRRSQQK